MTPAGLAAADRDRGVHLLDVNDPTSPQRLGGYETLGWASGLAVAETGEGLKLYAAAGREVKVLTWRPQEGFLMTDVLHTPGIAHDAAGNETRLAVADGPVWNGHDWEPGGLRVLMPDSGQEAGFYASRDQAVAVTAVEHRVYLADDADGVHVYELTPDGLVELRWLDWPGHIRDLAFAPQNAWVSLPGRGLVATSPDLPEPFQVQFLYDGLTRVQGVAVDGGRLLVAESLPHADPLLPGQRFPSRIHVLDISQPQQVTAQAQTATPGQALDMALAGGYILLADGDAGLLVYTLE